MLKVSFPPPLIIQLTKAISFSFPPHLLSHKHSQHSLTFSRLKLTCKNTKTPTKHAFITKKSFTYINKKNWPQQSQKNFLESFRLKKNNITTPTKVDNLSTPHSSFTIKIKIPHVSNALQQFPSPGFTHYISQLFSSSPVSPEPPCLESKGAAEQVWTIPCNHF